MKDEILRRLARRRWLKRLIGPYLPNVAKMKIGPSLSLFYNVQDFTGPSFYVMYGGPEAFEHYEQKNKERLIDLLNEESVLFDIGANIGLYSVYFKNRYPGLVVHAFEPESLSHHCLSQTARLLGYRDFVINKLALGSQKEKLTLNYDPKNAGGHSLLRGRHRGQKTEEVDVLRLDDYVRENQITRLDVIKMDVEGFEYSVMAGGLETIRRFRPAILFECWHDDLQKSSEHLVGLLAKEVGTNFRIHCLVTDKVIAPEEFFDYGQKLYADGIEGSDYLICWE